MESTRNPRSKVVVTGGAGFIGSHVVETLLAQGREPVVLDNFASGNAANLPPGVRVIQEDVADPAVALLIADLGPDAIIHAAAQVSVPRSMAEPDRDRVVNLVGTAHVIAGAQRSGRCRLIFLSTGGGIYGETQRSATESSLPQPKSFYSIHKYAAERYLELSGVSYATARIANVYGPRQRSDLEGGVVAIFAERLLGRQPITLFGSGEQRRDFVHVQDVVMALLTMLDADKEGVWNVGTGRATSINELHSVMERVLGPSVGFRRKPARSGDVFSSCLAIGKIASDLGWRPTVSLEQGIAALAPDSQR